MKASHKHAKFQVLGHSKFGTKAHEWWLQDANFVINSIKNISTNDSYDFLASRIDYGSMGFFGHSFGDTE